MNDVRELCELALDTPAPPMPEVATVIRAAKRQNRYAASASVAALVAVIGIVFTVAGSHHRPTATVPQPAAAVDLPPVPAVDAAHAHSLEIARILVAAVPAGIDANVVHMSADGTPASTWRFELGSNYVSTTLVAITLGTNEGNLAATIEAYDKESLGSDLCSVQASALLARMVGAPQSNCSVVTIGGVQVRISSGDGIAAVRPLQGGFLAVRADEGLPFTPQRLAELAADPRMLP